jgi:hypothetical protein
MISDEIVARKAYENWIKENPTWDFEEFEKISPQDKRLILSLSCFFRRYYIGKIKEHFLNAEEVADHRKGCWVMRKIRSL